MRGIETSNDTVVDTSTFRKRRDVLRRPIYERRHDGCYRLS